MTDWKWPAVAAFGILVAAIVIMFGLANDEPTRTRLIGYLDTIVPFVVGAAAGGAAGGTVGFLRGRRLV
jgi:bacteriorhodopsin